MSCDEIDSSGTYPYLLDRATNIYNINGTVTARVLVSEPTMKIFSPQHLPYTITAITLLFLLGFCPTLFLCLCSTRLFIF